MTLLPGPDLGPFAPLAEYLQNITEALAATTTQREVIEIVLTPAVQALGATAGIVLLVDQSDQQMKIAGSQGYEDVMLTLWQEGPIEDHVLIADILRMREALYFEHAGALKEAYPELESRTGGLLPVANVTLPMFLDDLPLGVIVLDFKELHHFTVAERRFLKILSAQCAVALGRAEVARTLEAQVEERTRQLEQERAAQAAFVAFTEAVGTESDLPTLVRQAITVLQGRFPGASIVYYEEEDRLWKGRIWSQDMNPELVAVIVSGLPVETPLFAEVSRTRQPVFTDAWDAQRESVASSEEYGAAANYPLLIGGELRSLLSIGLRTTRRWSEADQALLRAVGQGLNLALERTETARQLTLQNAELHARTQALEGFAQLTAHLSVQQDELALIRRGLELLLSLLPSGYTNYWELRGERWRCLVQVGDVGNPDLQAVLDAGLIHGKTPTLDLPAATRQPFFQDAYSQGSDTEPEVVSHIEAVASLPLIVNGEVRGVVGAPLFKTRRWSEVDRAVLEAVVQSLGLALERAQGLLALTERTRELERSNAELQTANEELDAFAASASHDLRTPVRHVKSFAELARRALHTTPNPQAERHMQVVEDAAVRMNSMIDAMLELSRASRQELRLGPVNLQALVERAQADMAQELEGRTVEWRVNGLLPVTGDWDSLQQVITNLLSNAVKYSRTREAAVIEVWVEERPGEWLVSVRDNGAGFNPEYTQKLFGAFQRLHSQAEFEGTGVGLATVRRIIVRHGGQVSAQGQRDGGATFSFTLPKVD